LGRILQLYQLQSLDSEIDQVNHRLAEIVAKLGESEALKAARVTVEVAEKELRQAQATMQDLDLEVKSLSEKIANQEKKLYSGTVLNAKEAANLQDEVISLKRWHSEREEHLLEAMVALEESESILDKNQVELARIEAEWVTDQDHLKQEQHTLESKLEELRERRPTVVGTIDVDILREYESLRPKKAGRAIAAVKNSVCQGCGMTLSSSRVQRARAGTELMYCSTCGRILYIP